MSKKPMTYVRLGNSGLKVSRLILGTMQYGSKLWQPWILEEDTAIQHIKAAYDLGIQTFDTANVYSNGIAETILGKAIKQLGLPRDEIVVMTKIGYFVPKDGPGSWMELTNKKPEEHGLVNQGGLSRKHIFSAVKASLERLQLDYVDVLQCHSLHPDTPMEETMKALHDVVQAGYVRYIGMGGTCFAWQFQHMQNYAINNKLTPFISMQNQYSLISREDEQELFQMLRLFGVGSVPYSPLARGHLARPVGVPTDRSQNDRFFDLYKVGPWEGDQEVIRRVEIMAKNKSVSMTQVAIAWLLHQQGVTAPIIGPTSIEQLTDTVGALDLTLDKGELDYLNSAYHARPALRKYSIAYYDQWSNWR